MHAARRARGRTGCLWRPVHCCRAAGRPWRHGNCHLVSPGWRCRGRLRAAGRVELATPRVLSCRAAHWARCRLCNGRKAVKVLAHPFARCRLRHVPTSRSSGREEPPPRLVHDYSVGCLNRHCLVDCGCLGGLHREAALSCDCCGGLLRDLRRLLNLLAGRLQLLAERLNLLLERPNPLLVGLHGATLGVQVLAGPADLFVLLLQLALVQALHVAHGFALGLLLLQLLAESGRLIEDALLLHVLSLEAALGLLPALSFSLSCRLQLGAVAAVHI
mmetsp:Transcript_113832/g.302523  ORF Transcript_113832/g.302523 Transcript_113832/m.302523 type:complete len:274 (-) Transcript_113832:722-1543(-)